VSCISTVTAIPPKISPRLHPPQTTRHPCKESAAASPQAAYDRAYGDAGRLQAQARQPQLGAPHPAFSRSRHRVRAAGEAPATRAGDVRLVARAARLVRAEQESNLHPRMAPQGVGHHRRCNLQRHRLTAHARWCLNPAPARSSNPRVFSASSSMVFMPPPE
jgi:hypothetical protein